MGKLQLDGWQRSARGIVIATAGLTACGAQDDGAEAGAGLRTTRQALAAAQALVAPCGSEAALRCRWIASNNQGLAIGAARPALNDAGLVAFAGNSDGAASVLLGRGRGLSAIDIGALGLDLPVRVALDAAGRLAFLAPAPETAGPFGAFGSARQGRRFVVHYAATAGGGLDGGLNDGGAIVSQHALALAPNGTLAFSSIDQRNGEPDRGALYRGAPLRADSVSRVVSSSDVTRPNQFGFSNLGALDVNAAGAVAAQMQHVTRCGLQNGVLVFTEPEPSLAEVAHVITGLAPDLAPALAIDDSGLVAFALPGSEPSVMVLRCPPAGNFQTSFLPTGVYTAQPTPFTEPPSFSLVADNSGPFASFGAVDVAGGRVVFEATLDAGGSGVFRGPDAERHAIVRTGDELAGEAVNEVQLGQLNHAGEVSLLITSTSGRSVWRVAGLEP